jgi:hypothetical protein
MRPFVQCQREIIIIIEHPKLNNFQVSRLLVVLFLAAAAAAAAVTHAPIKRTNSFFVFPSFVCLSVA